MSLRINFCPNGYLTPPEGYPVRLSKSGETVLDGFITPGTATVVATVKTDFGKADVHMALYMPPTGTASATVDENGSATTTDDKSQVANTQVDISGLAASEQTLTVTIPSSDTTAPASYVIRLWVDNFVGTTAGQVRKNGVPADTLLPAVIVSSVVVT